MAKPRVVSETVVARSLNDFSLGQDALELRVFDEAKTFVVAASYGGGKRQRWEFTDLAEAYAKYDAEPRSVVYATAGLRTIVLDGKERDRWLARWNANRTGITSMSIPAYLLHWNGNGPSGSVAYRFASVTEAKAYEYERLDGGRTSHVIATVDDLSDRQAFSGLTLITIYGKLTGRAVTKFENREVATRRTFDAIVAAAVEPPTAVKPSLLAVVNSQLKISRPKEKKLSTTEIKSTRTRLDLDAKIKFLVEGNPCRPNTGHWERYSLYKPGMKVADYLAAGGRAGDVRWDVAHGFIELDS